MGVSGRKFGASGSARRINCMAVKGEPLVEGVDFRECGLPEGDDKEKEGKNCPEDFLSGVFGAS